MGTTTRQQSTAEMADRPALNAGWITRFGLLYLGQNMAWAGPTQLLIAQQIALWHPENKENLLAWLMAVGGVASMIATPLAGAISDRTRSRIGRRTLWILLGALGAAASLLGASLAPGYGILFGCWVLFQITLAFAVNAAQTLPTDNAPTHQFGLVSGVMGLTFTAGIVVGTGVATLLDTALAYQVTAAVLVLLTLQFWWGWREPEPRGPVGEVASERVAWAPNFAENKDYWWVFIARLLVTMGQTIALFYLFYYLRDRIQHPDPDAGVLVLTVVYALAVLATAVLGGKVSDRLGKRKVFVAVCSYGVALAAVVMAATSSFVVVVGAAALVGVSWGIYTAVDQALINEVLPRAQARGRDIGIMNIAVQLPNSSAPLFAAFALAYLGGYPGLYLMAAVLAIIGGFVIRFARTAR